MNLWVLDLKESMTKMLTKFGSKQKYYSISGLMSRDIVMKAWCLIKALKYNETSP